MDVSTPPSDLDCESAVLSACLHERKAYDQVQSFLQSKHFYADANRLIYQSISELLDSGKAADVVTVAALLRDRKQIQKIGGSPYLAQIADATPAVAHVEEHARVIVSKWHVRQVIATCQSIAIEGHGDIGAVTDWMQEVDARVYAATRANDNSENVALLGTAAAEETERIRERKANKGVLFTGITTGLPTLDARIGGLIRKNKYTIAARAGMGKAQPKSAKVLTPTGWVTMGDLKEGDLVIGAKGRPVLVKRVFERGELPVFRVVMHDGGSTMCCDEHLWLTRSDRERKYHQPATLRTLHEIRHSLRVNLVQRRNHSIPYVAPVRYESKRRPTLHPYALGAYLGDGSKGNMLSNPEPDVQRIFISKLPPSDTGNVSADGISLYVRRKKRSQHKSSFAQSLIDLGLANAVAETKFIPKQYLHASIEDRLQLLRGLCDTDGYVPNPKNIEYTTASRQLALDLQELVRGLGGRISCVEKETSYSYKGRRLAGQTVYRMVFGFPAGGITPVASAKHLAKWDPKPIRVSERFIDRVEPAGTAECRCIQLDDEDHLYVTDDYIVTHNTGISLGMALAAARAGHGVVFCSLEMPRDQLALRALGQEANIDTAMLGRGRITDEQFKDLVGACVQLSKLPMIIFDQSTQTVGSVRACIREGRSLLREKFGDQVDVELVVIDFLQIMDPGKRATGIEDRDLGMITLGTAQLAKDENVALIELSQLNRDLEKRPRDDRRPKKSDLRGSGNIEQNTFGIFFVYRDDVYKKEGEARDNDAEIIVNKLRQGGREGTVRCKFKEETVLFYESSTHPDAQQLGDMFDDQLDAFDNEPPPDWHDGY